MKICFIYSGLTRTLIDSIKLLNEKITDETIKYDICVYSEINEIETSYLHKKYNINNLYNLNNIKTVLIENKINIPDKYKTEKEINIYCQWYKINRIFSIIDFNINYDYIIRIRSDLFILENLDSILLNLSSDKLYIPISNDLNDFNNNNGINDQFAIGSPEIMKVYSNLINNIDDYITSPNIFSEFLLLKHLTKYNIHIARFNLNYKLILSLCNVIAISGNSGSGKSTITEIIKKVFKFDKKIILETDRYHKWERGHNEWINKTHLNPESNYLEKLHKDTFNLRLGNDIFTVDYDHSTGKFTSPEKIESNENIIICGLHTLYNDNLRDIVDFKIFVDTQESLQKYWKLKRDVNERGYTTEKVINSIESRKEDYNKYILPQKNYSDIIISFYSKDSININEWNKIPSPNILLKINIKLEIYHNILYEKLNKFKEFINTFEYNQENVIIYFNDSINKKIIYDYITNHNINFINIDEINDGYYGIIQLIFIILLYKL